MKYTWVYALYSVGQVYCLLCSVITAFQLRALLCDYSLLNNYSLRGELSQH